MNNFPAFVDHIYALLFGLIIPFVSGYRSNEAFKGAVFDSAAKKRLYKANSFSISLSASLILAVWMLYRRPFGSLGFNIPGHVTTPVIILTALFIVLYIADTLYSFLNKSARAKIVQHRETKTPFMPAKTNELPLYFIMCVCAGFFEEIIYRGFLITYCGYLFSSYNYPGMWAVTVPALVFSIAHIYQGHKAVFKILVLSILFGLIYYYSQSLLIVIILHFLVDWTGGLLNLRLSKKQ
jgi:membrane protease YdiL (CAAX protease family)